LFEEELDELDLGSFFVIGRREVVAMVDVLAP